MLGTARAWRGAVCAGGTVVPRPENNREGLLRGFRRSGHRGRLFQVASETTGVSGLAARYAAALFDLADERRMLDEIASDLRQLRPMLQESGDFLRLIRSPVLSRDQQAN